MKPAISVCGISKSFRRRCVLDNVSLEVGKGRVFALLGLNGAGKTTLLKIILGFLKPDKGKVLLEGRKKRGAPAGGGVGYLPENFSPPPSLKAKELLGALAPGGEQKGLWEKVGLEKEADKRLGFYSRGMIQRFGLALCLLHDPGIIIMDEPTLGLDVRGQKEIFQIMAALRQEGKTIVFSSHILSQVESIADDIGVIKGGKVSFQGELSAMMRAYAASTLEAAFLRHIEEQ